MSGSRMPCALTIAGSDSGGGAGVQADLKTFAALQVHGLSAITALTAQSTVEVRAIHAVPPDFVRAQIDTVADDFSVRVAKTGMLHGRATIEVVAEAAARRGLSLVVDPVMVAESGALLIAADAVAGYRERLIPGALIVTPNLPEVQALLGVLPESLEEMAEAGRALLALGVRAALIKGGHRRGEPSDVLVQADAVRVLAGARIETTSTHGTGCTYSAAIAAGLAQGAPLVEAVVRAHRFVREAMLAAPREPGLGRGHGPLHHLHAFYAWPR